eukprot:gnl/TRDRNA2_/TRDRNA2_165209_c2_seq3.p1 gnl/TRDRNA2_/TRDRNA2_165209_c2~~gnl/TRDRNA2_/TRDRNA2_165209_c2_seq3.p1  ORF type:complete len:101 (+),score=6.44 gnl/TRDRNA2_/TRDRNA2_165209_c2_seq3:38-340(+)
MALSKEYGCNYMMCNVRYRDFGMPAEQEVFYERRKDLCLCGCLNMANYNSLSDINVLSKMVRLPCLLVHCLTVFLTESSYCLHIALCKSYWATAIRTAEC